MKEYQYRIEGERCLPREVYYQCVWMIRDMERLEKIAMSSNYESGQDHRVDDAIVKLDCLRRALEEIPDYYRQGVISSVKIRGGGFDDFAHINTWKKWKMRFMHCICHKSWTLLVPLRVNGYMKIIYIFVNSNLFSLPVQISSN